MYLVPDAQARRRAARRRADGRDAQAPLPRQPAAGVQGHARARARPAHPARPRGRLPRRPAVHRSTPTATRSPSCRRPSRVAPARCGCSRPMMLRAEAAWPREGGRRPGAPAGRGGGTSLPGKVLHARSSRTRSGMLAGAPGARRVVISATNGKTTTAAMVASILERTGARLVHNRAGANMAGGVASALAAAARRRARARRRPRPVRGRRVLARPGRRASSSRARCCSATCSATSSTATASSRRSPTAGRRSSPPARPHRARAQRRRPAGRRPRARRASARLLRRRGRRAWRCAELQHASDSKHCRRCGHAYVYEAAYLAPPRPLPLPELRARAGRSPSVAADRRRLDGIRSAAFTLRSDGGEARVELPLPGLYNVYNALGAAALCLRLGAPLDAVVAGLQRRRARVRPRRDDRPGRPPGLDPARQEPGRRERGAAHAGARGRARSTSSASSTTASPTGATSRGSGTPTGRCWRRTCAA